MGAGSHITRRRGAGVVDRLRRCAVCLLAVTGLAVSALMILTVPNESPAAAAGAPGSWQLDKSFAQTTGPLSAISCPTASECIAVGVVSSAKDVIEETTNGGATWTAQNVPAGTGVLYGISCPTATNCMAVGSTNTQGGVPIDIVTTNGGSSWTLNTIPGVLHQLYAVSCPSTTICTAVDGGAALMTSNAGATWSLVGLPADNESLDSISCPSTSTCVAGGAASQGGSCRPFPGCPQVPFYTWTTDGGSSWSESGGGSSGSLNGGTITSVSCPTTTQCMVAGDQGAVFSSTQAFAFGVALSGSCTIVTGCNEEGGLSSMTVISGVSCPSIATCGAVGDGQIATPNATGWTTQIAPIATVDAVSCGSVSNCMAAGATAGFGSAVTNSTDGGTSWATSFVAPYGVDDLDAVSCPSPSVCTAGGTAEGGLLNGAALGPGVVVNSTDGGATWIPQALPAGVATLSSISCASTSVCEALGSTSTGNPAIVGTTNGGSTWQSQSVPSGFAANGQLSCGSASDCTAVNGGGLFGTTDGGSTWASETAPAGVGLESVSCPSATTCTAVGFNGSSPAIVTTSDGGTTWNSQAAPSGSFTLLSVDCPSTTACVAMGQIVNQSFPIVSTSDAGATWTMTGAIAESSSIYQLSALACTSVMACSVVGEATVNDGPGIVEATTDGGATWASESAPRASLEFKGISCPAAGACMAVGDGTYTSGAVIIGQAPTTYVGIPANGATLSGSASLDAAASSPEGMGTVRFEVSGGSLSDQVVATATPTIYGWLASWNTTTVPNGSYSLQSVATDADGTTVTSAPINVTVANAPPSSAVLTPSNGATQSGPTQYLDAGAATNVTSVSFELSGGSLSDHVIATATPTIYGWLAAWNTTTVPNGTYSLQSVASYAGGVTGTSAPITITVNNPAPATSVLIPSNGATQSGSRAVLDATASSNIATVSFELSGGSISGEQVIAKGTLTSYGWLAVWDTTSVPDGTYSVRSVAAYASGMSTASAPITLTVNN